MVAQPRPEPEGELGAAIQRHRDQLGSLALPAVARMAQAYHTSEASLKGAIDGLAAQIAQATEAGEPVTPHWLVQRDRYRALLAQVEAQLARITPLLTTASTDAQRQAARLGPHNAAELTRLALGPVPPGASLSFATLPDDALTALVGATADGGPLARLFTPFGPQAAQMTRDALIAGLALGQGPQTVAQAVRAALGTSLTHATTIAQTESVRAYRDSSRQFYEANGDVVAGWVWQAALSLRTCPLCLAMSGRAFPLTYTLTAHPRCRCVEVPQTKSWAELGFHDIPDTRPPLPDAQTWLDGLAAVDKARILGKLGAELYDAGKLGLADLVRERHDPVYGRVFERRSLADAGHGPKPRGEKPAQAAHARGGPVPDWPSVPAAEEWLRAEYPAITFDLRGMVIETARPTMQALVNVWRQYPWAIDKLTEVGTFIDTSRGLSRVTKWGDPYAHANAQLIGFNPRWYGDAAGLQASLTKDTRPQFGPDGALRWHPAGTDRVDSVAVHEFAHAIDFNMQMRAGEAFTPGGVVQASGDGLIGPLLRRFKASWYTGRGKNANIVSEYAKRNEYERFAETFAHTWFNPPEQWTAEGRAQRALLDGLGDPAGWTRELRFRPDVTQDEWDSARAFIEAVFAKVLKPPAKGKRKG